MEPIQIVAATNDSYAKPLAVMLYSLLCNEKSAHPIRIYVLEGSLSHKYKELIYSVVIRFNVELDFIKVDDALFDRCIVSQHISKEAYYRINIPNLLPNDIDKVLYLDCDLIIEGDISEVWNTSLDSVFLAAVWDPSGHYRTEALGVPSELYFNSGVLLINLNKWREHRVTDQVLKYIEENPTKIYWWDQDALNAILHDKWQQLDLRWNYQPFTRLPLENPQIIHFISEIKPWNGDPPFKEYYFKYHDQLHLE